MTTPTISTEYEVEKFGRGLDGKWFGFGARRFRSLSEARSHFERFAAQQHDVLCNGVRIDLRTRKGRVVIATVGGRLHNATAIRELDSAAQ